MAGLFCFGSVKTCLQRQDYFKIQFGFSLTFDKALKKLTFKFANI